MEDKIESKYENKQLLLKIILFTEYISFICLVIGQMRLFADFSYQLHEIMYLPINIAIFVLPLEMIVFIYYRIRWRIQIRGEEIKNNYWRLKKLITVILVLIPVIYFIYMTKGVHTTGIYDNISKQRIENKFYITIEDKNIRCTNNEYNLIDTSKEYMISYEWNKFFPTKGRLKYIELIDKTYYDKVN